MGQAKWIWFPGDYELYHNIQLHTRREGNGFTSPAYWDMAAPYPVGDFYRTITAEKDFTMKGVSDAKGCGHLDGRHFPLNEEIRVPAGTHEFRILLIDGATFPSFFIDSPYLITDENWEVTHGTPNRLPAACEPAYTRPEDRPTVFPFSYERMDPVQVEKVDGGLLYDFGKELFGLTCIEGADPADTFLVNYGESREEALDREDANVKEVVSGKSAYRLVPRGFRYLFLDTSKAEGYTVWADYEYLPLEDIGSFRCSDPMVEKIYETCAYTFHLNSREFYLDGIKRDRWVWSGDAYQSYKINNYLYFDPGITRRTLIALLGKPAYESHINFINDYTFYLLIALYEFYEATGDSAFLEFIYPRAKALYDFAVGRLDDDGLVCQREGDWIFIDWSDMDKSGPLCAEQILLWQTHRTMAKMAELTGRDGVPFRAAADRLRQTIMEKFWDEGRSAFIDTFTSGKNQVTRHANIFAILYDFVPEDVQRRILKKVLQNPAINQITTPYFKFYELEALCKLGELDEMQEMLESYWGGMLRLGATTIWEQFDPRESGTEHLAMYGSKYGRSLCHAWGSGPIYLLGRYCLGVAPTDVAYRTFTVEPKLGRYTEMEGTVPLCGGKVDVRWKDGKVTVLSTKAGGTLRVGGKDYPLPAGEAVTAEA